MQSQSSQFSQFTQSELQQLKVILSHEITDKELLADGAKRRALFWKERGSKLSKDFYFTIMRLHLNKAKKLAKLQKKIKNLISGKESF